MDERTMLRYVDELQGQIDRLKKMAGGGGGGTKDYDKLNNRPKVNNITLSGNKKSSDLKIAYNMTEAEYESATKNPESIYFLQENAGTLTDSAYVNLEVADWTEVSGVYKQTKPFVFEVTPAAGWTVEDVSIETGIAAVDSYEVTEDPFGLSITYVAETLPEYGITATVTVTINQPAGSTRIVKNSLEFGRSDLKVSGVFKPNSPLDVSTTFTDLPFNIYGHKFVAIIVNNGTDVGNGAYSEPAFFNIDSYADFYGIDVTTTDFKVTIAGYSDRSTHVEFAAGGYGVRVTTASGTGGAGYKPILHGIIVYD